MILPAIKPMAPSVHFWRCPMIFPWKNHGFQSGPRRQDLGHLLPGFQGDAARIALMSQYFFGKTMEKLGVN